MQRNQRKLQVLQILAEALSSLEVEEIAEHAGISKHHALVTCFRYQEQGLIKKTGSTPTTFRLTTRGFDRLEFLISK